MIFLWSDTHFNHVGVIKYCNRPDADVQAMNARLEEAWNETVGPTDTIYHLGDFGFSHSALEPLAEIFARLNGHKHLVIGNHDERNPKTLKLPWESKQDLITLKENGVRAVACHYPLETWKSAHGGYLMLHGHSHGSLKRKLPHRFDMGCDVWPGPVALSQLAVLAAEQTYVPTDHHGEDI
jgi:calcineurin-like phosphoesterase family protein